MRLYPASLYQSGMQENHSPAVVDQNLNHLVLQLKRLDIADMGQCRFLDRPGTGTSVEGVLGPGPRVR